MDDRKSIESWIEQTAHLWDEPERGIMEMLAYQIRDRQDVAYHDWMIKDPQPPHGAPLPGTLLTIGERPEPSPPREPPPGPMPSFPTDIRPRCCVCRERWCPPEGVHAEHIPCPKCRKRPPKLKIVAGMEIEEEIEELRQSLRRNAKERNRAQGSLNRLVRERGKIVARLKELRRNRARMVHGAE